MSEMTCSSDPRSFSYDNLHGPLSIRLFVLYPGADNDMLSGSLINARLDDDLDYEAVSYVWGSEEDKVKLECDGQGLDVTQNLAAALRRFRLPTASRVLWTDSICINQSNMEEKSHQVRLMTQIYRQARRVLIWLGEASDEEENTAMAFSYVDLLVHRVWPRLSLLLEWEWLDRDIDHPHAIRNAEKIRSHFELPEPGGIELNSLQRLLQRAWFNRIWTFQESFVARERLFHCGDYRIVGDDMAKVLRLLWKLYRVSNDRRYYPYEDIKLWNLISDRSVPEREASDPRQSLKFLSLLRHRRGSGCKDPRDLIYALLGVAPQPPDIDVRYDQPLEQVFAISTAKIVSQTGSLHVFDDACLGEDSTNLPTWVPDWRVTSSGKATRVTSTMSSHRYSATGSSLAKPDLSHCTKYIKLQGLAWDLVRSCTDVTSTSELLEWMKGQFPEGLANANWYDLTNESLASAILRTQCLDLKFTDTDLAHGDERWDSEYEQHLNALTEKEGDTWAAYLSDFTSRLAGRRFALTSRYYLTILPRHALPGDIVTYLMGGEAPIILRYDPSDGKYTLVGECYLHGLMDGQALVEARRVLEPDYDHLDTSWLQRLHEEPMPFPTATFTIK